MAGIIIKGSNGLFDNEIEFQGKYATEIRFLRDEVGIFNSFRDAYLVSAIVGFLTKADIEINEEEKVQAASIFPTELNKRKKDLRFVYQLIMLLDENPDFNIDDYKNRTFREDPEEYAESLRANMALYNSYVCKGIDYLYNKFQDCPHTEIVDKLYDFVHEVAEAAGLVEGEELPEFTPKFD